MIFRPALPAAALAVTLGAAVLPLSTAAVAHPVTSAAPRAVTGPDLGFGPAARNAAMAQARHDAAGVAKQLGLTRTEKLVPHNVERDADGTMHVHYDRTVDGLKVIGGDLIVHRAPSGTIRGVDYASEASFGWVHNARGAVKVSARAATQKVAARHNLASGRVGGAKEVVWAVDGVPRIAWQAKVNGANAKGAPVRRVEYVDAFTGKHIAGWSTIDYTTANGTGKSLYSGTVPLKTNLVNGKYQLKDMTRGKAWVVDVKNMDDPAGGYLAGTLFTDPDNTWGSGTTANRQSAAVDAAYGGAQTWDFYKNTYGRSGIRGDGVGAKSRVHYSTGYDNAFWDDGCFCMTYGDGGTSFKSLVSLDVAGHEMSHGVTSNTAGLIYFGESGGLNEATSDIFGTMVEFGANNASDPGDYYIGEKIMKPGQGVSLRRMDQPSTADGSDDCWFLNAGTDDVHTSSGIGNHFFYLLSEGTAAKTIGGLPHDGNSCTGNTFAGIGRDAAAAIWWRALSVYMTSSDSYIDARDATIRAARDLYPSAPAKCTAVVRAWNAVKVPDGYWTCAGQLDEGASTITTNPGFENGLTGWTASGPVVSTDNTDIGFPHSGLRWADFNDQGSSGTATLTRSVTVPNTATANLRFSMLIWTKESVFGSAFDNFDIFVNGNPIADGFGHWDNTYANNTYIRWDVPMGAYAGQTVTLQFKGVEDSSLATQFAVDDVTLTPR